MREEILLNDGWRFCEGDLKVERPKDKGPVYQQAKTERKLIGPAAYKYLDEPDVYWSSVEMRSIGWKNVDLPHDYIITQTPNEEYNNANGYFEYKNAWYRKHFRLSAEDSGKVIKLFFEGVMTHATVYINGCLVKHNFCGYTSFEVDITDYVFFDENRDNIIAVFVSTEEFEGWWYQGGGIYRNVWLIKTDPVYIDLWGVYVKPRLKSGNEWEVNFETTVANSLFENMSVTAVSKIIAKDGAVIAAASGSGTVCSRGKTEIKYETTVTNPLLWDTENPNLYTVKTVIATDAGTDENTTRTGFRTVVCDPDKGLFINGRHTVICGVCCHQDFGLTGIAVPDNIHRTKIQKIKEMGANGYRTSHYPHAAATMDALDEFGFIVMDETRWFESSEESLEQLRMLVKRDRNRPGVVFWSTGNEEISHANDRGRRIGKAMRAEILKLDDTRFIMNAVDKIKIGGIDEYATTVFEQDDVIGMNYNLQNYDLVRENNPNKAFVASECCATSSTRGFYFETSPERGYYTAYDKDTTNWFSGREKTWRFLRSKEYVMGEYQWIAIEHRGETYWPRLCSQSGAIDMFLQRKDAFYQNLSHWTEKPMAHIMPHWNWSGLEGEKIRISVYTNCNTLELYFNGELKDTQKIEKYGRGEFSLCYEPGTVSVKAYKEGALAAEDAVTTTGKPVKLKLRLENTAEANGMDIALFTCYCVDENGNTVPDAAPFVKFSTNGFGKVVGTGSDVCDHVPPCVPERKMRAGAISVAVKLPAESGELKLYAESDELGYAVFTKEF